MDKRIGLRRLIDRITDNAMMERLCSTNRGNGEKHRPLSNSDMLDIEINDYHQNSVRLCLKLNRKILVGEALNKMGTKKIDMKWNL